MITRALNLSKILNKKKSAFLFGSRGVGKTTLVNEYLKNISQVMVYNLLETDTYTRLLVRPELLRAEIQEKIKSMSKSNPKCGVQLCVFIDEIQKIPILLDEVHNLLESNQNKIHFLLTGSSARKLKRVGTNLLGGRAWTFHLHPLTHLEWEQEMTQQLQFGAIPSIVIEKPDPARTLRAYVGTYLKEEIQQETQIRNLAGFTRFLEISAQMHGEPTNFTKMAKEAGISTKTAQEYFEVLQDTLVAFRIDAWGYSVRKQVQKSPKFYFFDCGVLNAIRGDLLAELKPSSFRFGKLFETMIILECIRLNDYYEKDYRFYYWRTNTGQEVDLIIRRESTKNPFVIEIKSSTAPDASDTKGLKAFLSENPKCGPMIISRSPRAYEINSIPVLPWKEALKKIFTL